MSERSTLDLQHACRRGQSPTQLPDWRPFAPTCSAALALLDEGLVKQPVIPGTINVPGGLERLAREDGGVRGRTDFLKQ
jgi:hypothetical protein